MQNICILLAISLFCLSCSSGENSLTLNTTTTAAPTTTTTAAPTTTTTTTTAAPTTTTTTTTAAPTTTTAAPTTTAQIVEQELSDTAAISIENFSYSGAVEIISGQKVIFTNNDVYSHTATASEFSTGNLKSGESAEITFNTPGTYEYFCSLHPYMTGTIKVLTSNSTTTTPTTTMPLYNPPPVYNPPSYDYGY